MVVPNFSEAVSDLNRYVFFKCSLIANSTEWHVSPFSYLIRKLFQMKHWLQMIFKEVFFLFPESDFFQLVTAIFHSEFKFSSLEILLEVRHSFLCIIGKLSQFEFHNLDNLLAEILFRKRFWTSLLVLKSSLLNSSTCSLGGWKLYW